MMMMMMMMMVVTTSQVPRFKRQVVAEAGSVGLGKSALPLLGDRWNPGDLPSMSRVDSWLSSGKLTVCY